MPAFVERGPRNSCTSPPARNLSGPWTLQSLPGPGPTALSPPVRPVPRRLASAIEPGF